MKFISALIIPFTLLTISSGSKAIGANLPTKPYIVTDYIGPFTGEEDQEMDIHVVDCLRLQNLYIYYYYKNTGALYASETYPLDGTPDSSGHTYYNLTVTMPLKDRMTNGVKIVYKIGTSESETLYTITVFLYKCSPITIDASRYKTSAYSINYRYFKINKNTSSYKETLKFNGFPTQFTNNRLNYIDFANFYFTYGITDHTMPGVGNYHYIEFEDKSKLFPHMRKVNGKVQIPITMIRSGGIYTLVLAGKLYVNPRTLQICNYEKYGYEETTRLYLPINDLEKLESYDFYIRLKSIGYLTADINYKFAYSNSYQYFGSCNNSTYCIGGGE